MSGKTYYIYIMTNKKNGTLYVGMTNNLERRVYEHKNKLVQGFTSEHSIDKLVYYDYSNDIGSVIKREKQLKAWKRDWRIELIEKNNPNWDDLACKVAV